MIPLDIARIEFQWVIARFSDGSYRLTQYECNTHQPTGRTEMHKVGGSPTWSYIDAPLEEIRKQETDRLKEKSNG